MHSTQVDNGETSIALAGVAASPSRSTAGPTAEIIPFPTLSPPPWAGDDEDADCWESVGILAVRLLGNFLLPKLLVMRQDQS